MDLTLDQRIDKAHAEAERVEDNARQLEARRKHPICNWLLIERHQHQLALEKILDFRDASPDPMASGLPPAAIEWFWKTELPRLAKDRGIRIQIEERIDDLSTQESNSIRQNLPREQVQAMQKEKLKLELILAKFIKL
jgi:hypothetical protein